jgi:tetratricopeptide (TPR) repeat protein
VLPPPALLARLGNRLGVLTGGRRDAPARQQTLRAAIAWSHDLLTPAERTLFARLAVFAGGCTLEAAEAVCGAGPVPARGAAMPVLDGLGSLLDKSLLHRELPPGGPARFRMLETVREYALERLEAAVEGEAARARHAAFYQALAEEAGPQLTEPGQAAWLERLEPERQDLDAALAWLCRHEPEAALRMATRLAPLWRLRGPFRAGWGWLRRALEAAPDAPAETRAEALQQAAELAFRLGEYAAAARALEDAVAQRRRAGPPEGAAYPLHLLGTLAHRREDYPRAVAFYEEALALWRAAGDRWGVALSLHTLGVVADERGERDRAVALYEEALALWRGTTDAMGVAVSLDALGRVARARGDLPRAAALHEEALALKRRLGDRLAVAMSLDHLGAVARARGDLPRAAALHEEALALKREVGEERLVEFSLHNLCLTALRAGDRGRAAALGREALARCLGLGKTADAARRLEELADALAAGAPARATALLGAAAALRAAAGVPPRDPVAHERRLARLRGALRAEAFASTWAAGLAMSPEHAVEHALAPAGSGAPPRRAAGRRTAPPASGQPPRTLSQSRQRLPGGGDSRRVLPVRQVAAGAAVPIAQAPHRPVDGEDTHRDTAPLAEQLPQVAEAPDGHRPAVVHRHGPGAAPCGTTAPRRPPTPPAPAPAPPAPAGAPADRDRS